MSKKDTSKQGRTEKNNDDDWKPDKSQTRTIQLEKGKKKKKSENV